MNSLEQMPEAQNFDAFKDFGMVDFDINEAFQLALHDVVNDKALALDEKVRRMEVIVSEGTSNLYREFVDFRILASQIEIYCNHEHDLYQMSVENELLANLLSSHSSEYGHGHHGEDGPSEDDDEDEVDKKNKKAKKRRGWFQK